MADVFAQALAAVLIHEGGYVNHPKDPGGATNKGVTQAVYDQWRRKAGKPVQSVRDITTAELGAIYRSGYWDAASCDKLPPGVSYMIFDLAVNSGPGRAAKFLQECAGVVADGKIGPKTLDAVNAMKRSDLIRALQRRRERFYRGLPTFATFGKGWMRRLDEVTAQSLAWAR